MNFVPFLPYYKRYNMKTGFIGGTGYASTLYYYQSLNERLLSVSQKQVPHDMVFYSLDFRYFKYLYENHKTRDLDAYIYESAAKLKATGVQEIALLAVTLHKWANDISSLTDLPVIHISDSMVRAAHANNIHKVLFLGTLWSMEEPFITERLTREDLSVIVPSHEERRLLHDYIYNDLTRYNLTTEGQNLLRGLCDKYQKKVDGIILGCTELPYAFKPIKTQKPVLSATDLHIDDILKRMLANS